MTFKEQILAHIFYNNPILGIGDTNGLPGSASAGNLYVRLCTGYYGEPCTEANYDGYTQGGVAVPRTSAAWIIDSSVSTIARVKCQIEIDFGTINSGSASITFVELWADNISSDVSKRIAVKQLYSPSNLVAGNQVKIQANHLSFQLSDVIAT